VETNGVTRQVIGVVPLLNCWDHLEEPDPCVFVPVDTRATKTIELKVASYAGMNDAIRRTVRELNPNVLVPDVKTIEQHMRSRLGVEIFATVATGLLAIIGVILSAIGCYAVFSSMVKESTREITLRLALGAPVSRLLSRIILRSTVLCVLGIVAGTILAVVIATQFQDQLFNVLPSDRWVLASTAILIVAVAVIASLIPGRLIAKTDPASALRII
jgi:ABC-type antimicrobial peptide transport system permease subunit